MPAVPNWLTPVLQQFPIAGIALGCVWIGVKWADRRHDAEVARTAADLAVAR